MPRHQKQKQNSKALLVCMFKIETHKKVETNEIVSREGRDHKMWRERGEFEGLFYVKMLQLYRPTF